MRDGVHHPFVANMDAIRKQVELAGVRFANNSAIGNSIFDLVLPDAKIAIEFFAVSPEKRAIAREAGFTVLCFSRQEIRSGTALDILLWEIRERGLNRRNQ